MAKLPSALLLLLLLSAALVPAAAVAGPTQPPRPEASASHQHRYWLSQDFQRLVFWQAPSQSSQRR